MPDRDVRGRRDPLLLAVCVGALVSSISYVSGVAPAPGSAAEQMPGWLLVLWYGQMMFGSVIGIVSAAWPRRQLLRVVQLGLTGLTFMASALTMFVVAIFVQSGLRGLGGGVFIAALAGACIWRGMHYRADIRKIEKIMSDGELTTNKEPP